MSHIHKCNVKWIRRPHQVCMKKYCYITNIQTPTSIQIFFKIVSIHVHTWCHREFILKDYPGDGSHSKMLAVHSKMLAVWYRTFYSLASSSRFTATVFPWRPCATNQCNICKIAIWDLLGLTLKYGPEIFIPITCLILVINVCVLFLNWGELDTWLCLEHWEGRSQHNIWEAYFMLSLFFTCLPSPYPTLLSILQPLGQKGLHLQMLPEAPEWMFSSSFLHGSI